MKKESLVVMLPTEKAGKKIGIFTLHGKIYDKENDEYYHLYGLSDETPKENDWCYDKFLGLLFQFKTGEADVNYIKKHIKKVIWTTDEDLKIEQDLGYLTLNPNTWEEHKVMQTKTTSLPRPSNEFLKKFCELGGVDKVFVEYEDLTETLKETVDNLRSACLEDFDNEEESPYYHLLENTLKKLNEYKPKLKVNPDNTVNLNFIE